MTKCTLESLATFPKLVAAWQEYWRDVRTQRSSGVDGVTPAHFNHGLQRNLHALRLQLLQGYRFDLLVAHPVPKPDGKKDRIICVPTVRDRLVQRLVGAHLSVRGERLGIVNDVSYGFVRSTDGKPRGVGAALGRAIGLRRQYPWAYKSDISSFFDRIPRDILFDKVVRTLRTPSLNKILHGAINCEIDVGRPAIRRKVQRAGIKPGQGVRQGMPLSPFFANIILKDFDRKFLSKGFHLVRYADDFIVLAQSEVECTQVDIAARNILGKLGFDIPEIGDAGGKTRICEPDQSVDFLGLSLAPVTGGDYALMITPAQLEKIKRTLYQLKDLDYLQREGINIINLSRTLENKIGGYRSAYPAKLVANSDDLINILDRAKAEIFTNIFGSIFGHKAIARLNQSEKRFLCLDNL